MANGPPPEQEGQKAWSREKFCDLCLSCEAGLLRKLFATPAVRAASRQFANSSATEEELGIKRPQPPRASFRGTPVTGFWPRCITPLFTIARRGLADIAKILIEDGASVNDVSTGAPPLFMAAQNDRLDAVRVLLSCPGVDPNLPLLDDNSTPLFVAAQMGHTEVVRELLAAPGIDLYKARSDDHAAPLSMAAYLGNTEIVALLLMKDASPAHVNLSENPFSFPLWQAAAGNHVRVVKWLLDAKAEVNVYDHKSGTTPLFQASQLGYTKYVEMLLKAEGIDVDLPLDDGVTPLLIAAEHGHSTIGGRGPLHFAVQGNHLECAKLLVARGADVNHLDVTHTTPLAMAALRGPKYLPMIKMLMENGADAGIKNKPPSLLPPVTTSLKKLKALPAHKLKSLLTARNIPVPSGVEKGELAAYVKDKAGENTGSSSAAVNAPALNPQPSQSQSAPSTPPPSCPTAKPSSSRACLWCGSQAPKLKMCGGCKSVWLCSADCQRASWPSHRAECKKLAQK